VPVGGSIAGYQRLPGRGHQGQPEERERPSGPVRREAVSACERPHWCCGSTSQSPGTYRRVVPLEPVGRRCRCLRELSVGACGRVSHLWEHWCPLESSNTCQRCCQCLQAGHQNLSEGAGGAYRRTHQHMLGGINGAHG
jgi:hypothetical protein